MNLLKIILQPKSGDNNILIPFKINVDRKVIFSNMLSLQLMLL